MKKIIIILVIIAILAIIFAINFEDSAPMAGQFPILTVVDSGGLCVYGPCNAEIAFMNDGAFVLIDGSGKKTKGRISSTTIHAIDQNQRTTDFALIKSKPFTGTCPSAYDGSESIYKFYGGEVIESCKFTIDWTLPLFQAIENALSEVQEIYYSKEN